MATIGDIERRVETLEMDMPTRKGYAAHLNDLDNKFQRLEEGQQRHELGLKLLEQRVERLDNKIDDGVQQLSDKLDAVLVHFKINFD